MNSKQKQIKVLMGGEPNGALIDCEKSNYRAALIQALNWYSKEKDGKDSRKYLAEWAKANDKSLLSRLETTDDFVPTTYGWIARLITVGAKLSEKELETFNKFVTSVKPKVVVPVVSSAPRQSIQESIKEKSNALLGEFEGLLDDLTLNQLEKNFDINNFLKAKEIGAPYLPYIDTWARAKLAQYLEVFKSKDPQIKEGYSNYKKQDLVNIMTFLKNVVEGVANYGQLKKANRKPRTRKIKPAGVQIKSLKFKAEDAEFNLKSVHPTEVVGAQQLWIFNCKYRKLGVYRTDTRQGLSVRGSTIQGWDPEQSSQKTLRKPEAVLKDVLSAGKVTLRRVLENIKGKEFPLNGRINDECILLRVVK